MIQGSMRIPITNIPNINITKLELERKAKSLWGLKNQKASKESLIWGK